MRTLLVGLAALLLTACGPHPVADPVAHGLDAAHGRDAAPTVRVGPPATLADLPVGAPSRVPWWRHGVLHVAGRAVETPDRLLVFAGGTTLVGSSSVDGGARWSLLDGSRLVPLASSSAPLDPVVSADGRTVAWSEATGRTSRHLVAYDVASRTVLGAEEVTVHPTCCDRSGDLFVLGVGADGRVVYDVLGLGTHLWTPGGADVAVRGLHGGDVVNPWPGGVMWQGRSTDPFSGTPGVYATVDASGAAHRVGAVPTDQLGSWSADGSAYAYPGQADGEVMAKAPVTGFWVDHLDGPRTPLELPAGGLWEIVGWETPTSLLLQVRNPYDEVLPAGEHPGLVALVRCDAATGACERTNDRVGGHVVLPS